MLCRTTWHPTAAQQCLPLCFLKSTSTFEFGVNCFINIVPLSSHYFNTWILFLFKQEFFFFSSMFSSVQLAHVLKACLSLWNMPRKLAEWTSLGKSDSASRQFLKVSFSACLRPLADRTIAAFPFVSSAGSGPHTHTTLQNVYYCLSAVFMSVSAVCPQLIAAVITE